MTEEKKDTTYAEVKVEKLPGSEIEITGEIPVAVAETYRNKAIKKFQRSIELPGFRKGNVPEEMIVKQVGESEIMKEIAELALGKTYADIVTDKKLDVVGRPMVTITKLAPGNPVGFKIKSAVYPVVELPDYKKIAAEEIKKVSKEKVEEVTDEDVNKELRRLQEMMTPPAQEGEEKSPAPELNDEFAKSIGGFKDLADLKEKMKEQIGMEREQKQKEKVRLSLAEAVIKKSKLEVPSLFVEGEIDQMVASFTDRVTRSGLELDAYLEQIKKTMDDLRKEWRPDAEKRAKLQLIFNEIAKKEGVKPDTEKLAREVAHIKEHYPDANEESVAIYVAAQMTNELVFDMLEGKKSEEKKASSSTEVTEDKHVHDEHCNHDH